MGSYPSPLEFRVFVLDQPAANSSRVKMKLGKILLGIVDVEIPLPGLNVFDSKQSCIC